MELNVSTLLEKYSKLCEKRDSKWNEYLENKVPELENELLKEYQHLDIECAELYTKMMG